MKLLAGKAYYICLGSMMTALVVICQSAPFFFPGAGMALSPFSALPIALTAMYRPRLGLMVWVAAFFIVLAISMHESLILLFLNGPFGLALGIAEKDRHGVVKIITPSAVLFAGMFTLTYLVGIHVFGGLTTRVSVPLSAGIFLTFALIYTFIWSTCLWSLAKRLPNLTFKR